MSNTAENLAAVERELAADVAMAEGAPMPRTPPCPSRRRTSTWTTPPPPLVRRGGQRHGALPVPGRPTSP
ncbi:MAG: hypothetical protein ACLSGS_07070 [Adlercreutzia sp.]